MDRCALEDALLHATALAELKVVDLQNDAEALDEEDAAEDGEHQLFVDYYCRHGDDAADGQRACVAHEHLGRIGVVPQEAYERADEGTHEHHKLLRLRDVHDVQVVGIFDVAAHISQDAYRHAYYRRVAGTHAVHAVVEVSAVRHRRDDKDGHDDEQDPACRRLILAAERHDARIVEVMAFDERYGGLQRLGGLRPVLDDHLLSLALDGEVLVHLHIGRHPQRETHDETNAHLTDNLVTAFQTFFVATENLDVVVHTAEKAEPHGGHNHEQQVDVTQTAKQDDGQQDGDDDDDTTHRGHTNLLHAERVYARVALCLGDLLLLKKLDELFAQPC